MADNMEFDAITAIAESMAHQLSDKPEEQALIVEGFRNIFTRQHTPENCMDCRLKSSRERFFGLNEDDGSKTILDLYMVTRDCVQLRLYPDIVLVFTSHALSSDIPAFKETCQYQCAEGVYRLSGPTARWFAKFVGLTLPERA